MIDRLRVVFFRNARGITDVTGAERYFLTLMEQLDPRRVDCHLVCAVDPRRRDTPWIAELARHDVSYELVDVPSAVSLADYSALLASLRRRSGHLVYSVDHRGNAVGVLAARRTGAAMVASFFGWTNFEEGSRRARLYPTIDRHVLGRIDAVISDSAFIGRQVDRGPDRTALVVIPHGIDLRRFDPDRVRGGLWAELCDGTRPATLIGTIGRIHPVKGQLEIVEAAARVHRAHPGARFVFIGEAVPSHRDYLDTIECRIRELNLESVVRVTNVPSALIPNALASMDIVLQPSLVESFSFSLLEAMAMGRAIVATRTGGTPEMIEDDATGLLIPPGSADEIAAAVGRLLADPGRRSSLGRAARRRLQSGYGLDAMRRRTLAVYDEVLAWKRRTAHPRSKRELRERLAAVTRTGADAGLDVRAASGHEDAQG